MEKDTETHDLATLIRSNDYKNIVFDFDETLVRLQLPWKEWKRDVMQLLSIRPETPLPARLNWEELTNAQIDTDPAFLGRLLEKWQAFENTHPGFEPYSKLLQYIPIYSAEGRNLYIWTNNTRATTTRILASLGILSCFKDLTCRDDVSFGKPHVQGWSRIHSGSESLDSYLLVGDSAIDEELAQEVDIAYFPIRFFKNKG